MNTATFKKIFAAEVGELEAGRKDAATLATDLVALTYTFLHTVDSSSTLFVDVYEIYGVLYDFNGATAARHDRTMTAHARALLGKALVLVAKL